MLREIKIKYEGIPICFALSSPSNDCNHGMYYNYKTSIPILIEGSHVTYIMTSAKRSYTEALESFAGFQTMTSATWKWQSKVMPPTPSLTVLRVKLLNN